MSKIQELNNLYRAVNECHVCPNMDREKALRLTQGLNINSDIFIIMQSLAENHLRKSGINFYNVKGMLGSTGANLEKFLNKLGSTIYPTEDLIVKRGTIRKSLMCYKTIYSSDIVLCYPGKSRRGSGDRKPLKEEIYTCINQGFLLKEISIIKPRIVMLMGQASRDNFYKYILNETDYPASLSEHIYTIIERREIPHHFIQKINIGFYVFPIQHSSGANPRFYKMTDNDAIIKLIKRILN